MINPGKRYGDWKEIEREKQDRQENIKTKKRQEKRIKRGRRGTVRARRLETNKSYGDSELEYVGLKLPKLFSCLNLNHQNRSKVW